MRNKLKLFIPIFLIIIFFLELIYLAISSSNYLLVQSKLKQTESRTQTTFDSAYNNFEKKLIKNSTKSLIEKDKHETLKLSSLQLVYQPSLPTESIDNSATTDKIEEDEGPNNITLSKDLIPEFPKYDDTVKNKKENGWLVVNNPHSLLVLVNQERKLPKGFVPKQLIEPDIRFSFNEKVDKRKMRAVAGLAIEKLFQEAEKDGHMLFAISGYRSEKIQIGIFDRHVNDMGEEKARTVSAYPGSSEHQTGLTMDVSSERAHFQLTEEFGETPEGNWLANNAHRFGFIIRYPKNKTDITGYTYEPWHIRYIGIDEATYLYENNLVLEEVIK